MQLPANETHVHVPHRPRTNNHKFPSRCSIFSLILSSSNDAAKPYSDPFIRLTQPIVLSSNPFSSFPQLPVIGRAAPTPIPQDRISINNFYITLYDDFMKCLTYRKSGALTNRPALQYRLFCLDTLILVFIYIVQ